MYNICVGMAQLSFALIGSLKEMLLWKFIFIRAKLYTQNVIQIEVFNIEISNDLIVGNKQWKIKLRAAHTSAVYLPPLTHFFFFLSFFSRFFGKMQPPKICRSTP